MNKPIHLEARRFEMRRDVCVNTLHAVITERQANQALADRALPRAVIGRHALTVRQSIRNKGI